MASRYTVVAPDLRGFGDSDKPASGYDKRTVAEDIRQLVRHLGLREIDLVGHDIGMMVASDYAAAHPQEVRRLAVAEAALPGLGLEELMDAAKYPKFWHFGFFAAPGVPEMLLAGREQMFLSYFVRHLAYDSYAVTEDDLGKYARRMAAPGALRGGFEHYGRSQRTRGTTRRMPGRSCGSGPQTAATTTWRVRWRMMQPWPTLSAGNHERCVLVAEGIGAPELLTRLPCPDTEGLTTMPASTSKRHAFGR
jgi:pimeloyl-ACP methyl ester carboxylesterase